MDFWDMDERINKKRGTTNMRVLCGTDIIEISRIKEAIVQMKEPFLERIYEQEEIAYCESKKTQKYQHYAARFAAKEAVFKAISELLPNNSPFGWKNIVVENTMEGKPKVHLEKIALDTIEEIQLSLSHCKDYAVAMAIVTVK